MATRTISLGARSYPLILPSVRDPRLHVAAVIITVHVLGQVGLGFEVSVPQILAAMLACAVIEVALTFRTARAVVWPASALLTGSGVALIMRVVGTPDDHWTTYAWWLFAGVAALSLLSKYVIHYRGSHVFNPSNVGLVAAFVVLGPTRVEPLDFWWAPFGVWLLAAYAVILGGGLLITRRLGLLALAGTFWVALAAGLGILALSGHCMTASWAFAPVCGLDFWSVIVTSPEVLIFLFFMITDPKTVPAGNVGRVLFGLLTALIAVFLMAPQTDEFGTKVGLLAGLVIACAARPLIDRLVPEPRSDQDRVGTFASRLVTGGRSTGGIARGATRMALAGLATLVVGIGIVAAGTPSRGFVAPSIEEVLNRAPTAIDPATLPAITVAEEVVDFDHELAGPEMQAVLVTLAQNLELENQALLRHDASILPTVAHGDRLEQMQERLQEAEASGTTTIAHYRFDTVDASLLVPFGAQTGLSLGLAARGTVVAETYDASGALQGREEAPFALTFAMRRATGDRWLTVAVLPGDASD